MKSNGKPTPKGTPSQPMRRAAKHKTIEYGLLLKAKADARRARRNAARKS
jgi:hypothetical protein